MHPALHGDRPIERPDQDEFGCTAYAARLADALTSQAASKGLVLGVEGRWGSGKSSLLALTLAELRTRPGQAMVVEFRPWLVGDRDQLLGALFQDLAKSIAAIELAQGDASRSTAQAVRSAASKARDFARHLGPIGKLAGLAGSVLPGAGLFGKVVEAAAEAARQADLGPTLAERKDELSEALDNLGHRIVVAIDDVDRLEPKEVAELLRLVRSVADFPNVAYLLCYDGATLGRAIERGTQVENGRVYLEKIVQTEIGVPRPESFALRRLFSSELAGFAECGEEVRPRLSHVIDTAGGRALDTPRTVMRVLDGLRIFWPALNGRADLADLVWIRIMAVTAPNTYRWIEEYVDANTAIAIGRASVGAQEQMEVGRRLDEALAADALSWELVRFEFHAALPGIGYGDREKDSDGRIFSSFGGHHQAVAVRDRRLASPDHGRLYFALAAPAGSVRVEEVAELLAVATRSAHDASAMLIAFSKESTSPGTNKSERLLDHLVHLTPEAVSRTDPALLAAAVSDAADDLAAGRVHEWGSPRAWDLAKGVLAAVRAHLDPDAWREALRSIADASPSIGFLTYLFRSETFGHGVYGGRPDPQGRLTSRAEFDALRDSMLARYRAITIDGVLRHESRTSMLYAWSQGGGRDELVATVADRARADAWLLRFLEAILSGIRSDDGEHPSLSPEAIGNFFDDVPAVMERVIALRDGGSADAGRICKALDRHLSFERGGLAAWIEHRKQAGDDDAAG